MADRECCVKNCRSTYHDAHGRKLQNGLTFHCFPAWRTREGGSVSELTRRRRAAWVAAVARSDITFAHIPSSMRVCSRHFHTGRPAFEMLDSDPDWVPSLHLGQHAEANRKRRGAEHGPDSGSRPGRPAPPPWREVRSALLSLLQEKPIMTQQNRGEPQERPADTSLRDFFRTALESSLEASIQARAQARSNSEYEVELNFELPPTRKESGSCQNCSLLLRRIQDLEQHLFRVASKQDREAVEARIHPGQDQNQQSSEEEQTSTDHLSPGEVRVDDDYEVLDLELAPLSPDSSDKTSTSTRSRPTQFQPSWLKTFPFLRYSPTQNLMWCHVCRVHAEGIHRNHSLIKGSNRFLKFSLTTHSSRQYHLRNLQQYQARSGSAV
ncbi:uncharacterized protein LOC106531035 [Austrofundulus limnaeus]|uniref:Uncharacterized protein LOC106531035 n=1 Tax=Austrofundulus limnaeus TaxID=52670 RepID=A0A2I4CQH7_AUSLI|nr:PREDICTED: uncharacterized protein LOC106531035 [Austrofundulus limnaeus]